MVCKEFRILCYAPQLWRSTNLYNTGSFARETEGLPEWSTAKSARQFYAIRKDSLQTFRINCRSSHAHCVSEILQGLNNSSSLVNLDLDMRVSKSGQMTDKEFLEGGQTGTRVNEAGALIWSAVANLTALQKLSICTVYPVSLSPSSLVIVVINLTLQWMNSYFITIDVLQQPHLKSHNKDQSQQTQVIQHDESYSSIAINKPTQVKLEIGIYTLMQPKCIQHPTMVVPFCFPPVLLAQAQSSISSSPALCSFQLTSSGEFVLSGTCNAFAPLVWMSWGFLLTRLKLSDFPTTCHAWLP